MSNVVRVAQTTKQPYGGFLRVRDMEKVEYDDGVTLHPLDKENVAPQLIGLAVDYLTRINLGFDKVESFAISLWGAQLMGKKEEAQKLFEKIDLLDDQTIINACKLVGFDTVYRAGPHTYRPVEDIHPNEETIDNVRTMVKRGVNFFENEPSILKNGITFEDAYTSKVRTGDADILTEDGLWDLKVLRNPINSKDTLQIMIYYLLGLHSIHKDAFEKVTKLGFYNPRLNVSYVKNIEEIDQEIFEEISTEVIGY